MLKTAQEKGTQDNFCNLEVVPTGTRGKASSGSVHCVQSGQLAAAQLDFYVCAWTQTQ